MQVLSRLEAYSAIELATRLSFNVRLMARLRVAMGHCGWRGLGVLNLPLESRRIRCAHRLGIWFGAFLRGEVDKWPKTVKASGATRD